RRCHPERSGRQAAKSKDLLYWRAPQQQILRLPLATLGVAQDDSVSRTSYLVSLLTSPLSLLTSPLSRLPFPVSRLSYLANRTSYLVPPRAFRYLSGVARVATLWHVPHRTPGTAHGIVIGSGWSPDPGCRPAGGCPG